MKAFEAVLSKFETGLWGYHLPVPDDIAAEYINGKDRRVIVSLNNSIQLHSAIMSENRYWFIMLNQQVVRNLRIQTGDKVSVCIEKDNSEYGMPMPEEMMVCMDQDEKAAEYFHNLTPGKQRSLIYIVQKVKNTDSRIRKSLAILHHLNANAGKLDFKMLHETLKDFNERQI